MVQIANYPDKKTVAYAELWSRDRFMAATWYGAVLISEDKGDERGTGATNKLDVPAPCFLVWHGTLPSGMRTTQLVSVGSEDKLANPPGAAFLPVYPGVNVLDFEAEAPPSEPGPPIEPTPEPQPEPPPQLPAGRVPHTITLYGSNVCEPRLHWWGDDLVFVVPYDWYLEAWEMGPKRLLEKIGEAFG